MDMFDTSQLPMRKMEGGGTVRTWDIPPECERLMYTIATNGRPLKAKVELVRLVLFPFFSKVVHFFFQSCLVCVALFGCVAPAAAPACFWTSFVAFGPT